MRTKIFVLFSMLIVASMVLAACAPPAAPTAEVKVETVVVTEIVEGETQVQVVTATPQPEAPPPSWVSEDPTTYTDVGFGFPDTLDPAFDYETGGGEVLQNVYDTLIFFNKGDPNSFVPQLALEVPSLENGLISEDGLTVTFNIRQGVKFHDGSDLKPSDIAYSFQRGILQGGYDSPQWLLTEPLLGVGISDISEIVGDGSAAGDPALLVEQPPEALLEACQKVVDAVVADDAAGTVVFKLAQPWAPFLPTLTQSWGSAQSKAWVSSNGGWDGDCATWQNFYGKSSEQLNELPLGSSAMGTGPFILDHWTPGEEWVLKANENYWRTEPAWEGGPTGAPALKTVINKVVDEFSTRYSMIQAGDADTIDIGPDQWPQMDELVGELCDYAAGTCEEVDPEKPLRKYINRPPTASRTDIFMNWNIVTEGGNNFIGSGTLDGNGIPPDFFSNEHVRKAFAYCYNYDAYASDVLQGEAERAVNVMLPGQIGYNPDSPFYGYDPEACKAEFDQVEFDGVKLNDIGFRMTMGFNTGNTTRQTICEIMQTEIAAINENFIVECVGLPWPTYLRNFRASKLPASTSGWVQDIDDPHNWVQPYAVGTFANRQKLPQEVKDQFQELINAGATEVDPAKRAEIYAQFNQLYYEQNPTILLHFVKPRRYEQRWVQGWFDNRVFFGYLYYTLSKK